ncbi:MAG: DinB family protein [Bacteroidetes bacterium]|nr:DinB family protein [Bacteroidota bacterium]
MNAQLEKQFLQLEEERKTLFSDLKNYTDDIINKKPSSEKWSVAEVIVHLITAEEMSLKYLSKKIQDTSKESEESFKNKYRWLLVKLVFAFNIKFKAPEIVEPKMGYQSLADLETKWSNVRNQTLSVLQKLSDEETNKTLWKHALAGKMNLHHMVQFFGVHYNRHKKQIERTVVAVK